MPGAVLAIRTCSQLLQARPPATRPYLTGCVLCAMGKIRIPYYDVSSYGAGYWRPSKLMRQHGFVTVTCGRDGPEAWSIAQEWWERWQRVKTGREPSPYDIRRPGSNPEAIFAKRVYPPVSLGHAFGRFRRTHEWKEKAPRTREEWDRAWTRIDPFFGDADPNAVTMEHVDAFRAHVARTVSEREAHRIIKIWRALWKKAAALKYCDRDADPSLGLTNRAAQPRQAVWSEGEVVRLVKAAWRSGYHGLAIAMALAWDTQLSPVDVRKLTLSDLKRDRYGPVFIVSRAKTGRAAAGTVSPRTARLLEAYVTGMGETSSTAPLVQSRGHSKGDGRPWVARPYTKDTLAKDFRVIRSLVLGHKESRTLADLRRSGAVEAMTGGATAEDLSQKMANPLSASNALHKTYNPVDLAAVRQADAHRKTGRRRIRENKG
jgi:hypothetical protein